MFFVTLFNHSEAQKRTSQTRKPKSKAQLEREKRENLNRIQEANRILEQTKQQKEASLGQLNAIKEKITVQKKVITNISSELNYIESDVKQTETVVGNMQTDLQKLKAEYATMIYGASKTANSYNKLMFLFAADSFNQFIRRLTYLRQYSESRKKQVAEINRVTTNLGQKLTVLNRQKRQKKNLLNVQVKENYNLLSLKDQQDNMVQQLSQKEKELRQEVNRRQTAVRKLDNVIANMVREEIARAARAAKSKAAAEGGTSARTSANRVTLTPETALLSSNFGGNKGRFSWPVERGFISQRFGVHAHPVLKNVSTRNNGIDIQTNAGESVRSIFSGIVRAVLEVPPYHTVVMIQHGEYFTTFSKLKSASVSEGQKVDAKEVIGTVYTNPDGTTELHFEIWRNTTKLNPEAWLLTR
ncbi:murein hydrolase activator EnvC family protein [Adhaeribacter swui]|uniref:murein hydrolase activator EnvC family protein n=1 Tax=Adhaeribacter swui TaxID=2086471 RepID=UPI001E611C92|nr:peptidoglycan DD-metalloendopeptidase family protein [Adhaeribacter swui]